MARLTGFLVVLILAAGCAHTGDIASVPEPESIRVLSYNIRHGKGMDGRQDLRRIAAVIRSVSPHVVSLQEVDNRTVRSGGVDQAGELARLTDMAAVFGASMSFQGGEYGNAVLTTLEVRSSTILPLPGEPRSALCVTLASPAGEPCGEEFLFIATHLDTAKEARRSSVPLIEELFSSKNGLPAILAGDLNAVPGSPTMMEFGKTWKNATDREGLFTFPAADPSRQIDYILYRPPNAWSVVETRVLEEAVASDHRAIFAVLERPARPRSTGGRGGRGGRQLTEGVASPGSLLDTFQPNHREPDRVGSSRRASGEEPEGAGVPAGGDLQAVSLAAMREAEQDDVRKPFGTLQPRAELLVDQVDVSSCRHLPFARSDATPRGACPPVPAPCSIGVPATGCRSRGSRRSARE